MREFFCIYTGHMYPEDERSREHIIPYALGGSNSFVTFDVSGAGNNHAGHSVDSSLINNWLMKSERWSRGMASEGGRIPDWTLGGTIDLGDGWTPRGKCDFESTGTRRIQVPPEVESTIDKKARAMFVSVRCIDGQWSNIAKGLARRAAKKGFDFNVAKAAQALNVTPIRVAPPKISGTISFDLVGFQRGLLNIALGAGHFVLGLNWSRGSHAATLRAAIQSDGPQISGVFGVIWPETHVPELELLRSLSSVSPDHHVIFVTAMPLPSIYVRLFGRYDILVGPQGLATPKDVGLVGGQVITVCSKTRVMQRFSIDEFFTRRLKEAYVRP